MVLPNARRRALAVLLFVVAGFRAGVHGQSLSTSGAPDLMQMPLEQLLGVEFDKVYGASRFVQDIDRAPASVTIISADEIAQHAYRTVAEAIATTAGFYETNDRNYSYVGVRGFGRPSDFNSRMLVLVDGHRLNDNIWDAAYLGSEFPIDISLVERIEIVRGPRSSVYGSNAFFAVINILTRRGRGVGRGELEFRGGSLGAARARGTLGGRASHNVEWLLSASAARSSGVSRLFFPEFNSPLTNFGLAEHRDAEDLENVFAQLSRLGLTIEAVWSRRRKAIPTASFGTLFNDPRTQTRDGRSYLNVEYGRTLPSRVELLARGYVDHVDYRGDYPAPWYKDRSIVSVQDDEGHGEGIGGEVLVTRRFGGRHVLTGGSELYGDIRQTQTVTESAEPTVLVIDERHRAQRWSLFAQDELTLHPRVAVNLGVRHDQHSRSGGTTNPRLGVTVTAGAASVVKLLYGTAFRAPSAYEQYYDTGGVMTTLKPERIRTTEAVFEQRVGSTLRASAAAFEYRIEDLITQVQSPIAIYGIGFANIDRVVAHGLELAVDARSAQGHSLRIAQTLQHLDDTTTHTHLSNSPRAITKVSATLPMMSHRVVLAADSDFLGRRLTPGGGSVDSRYLQHVTFTAPRVWRRLDVGLRVRNLFNTQYRDPAGEEHRQDAIPQDGRTLLAHATYRF